jgi:hypothetical protein
MEARQSSRVKTDAAGSCKSPRGFSWDVNVDDLSPGGCRVDDPRHGLELGKHIQLMIEETGPHTAEVAWRQGDRVGLEFIQPLADDVFELMASRRWEEARDAVKNRGGADRPVRFAVRRIM